MEPCRLASVACVVKVALSVQKGIATGPWACRTRQTYHYRWKLTRFTPNTDLQSAAETHAFHATYRRSPKPLGQTVQSPTSGQHSSVATFQTTCNCALQAINTAAYTPKRELTAHTEAPAALCTHPALAPRGSGLYIGRVL